MDDATKEDLLAILNEKQDEIEWLKAELDEANHSRELSDADGETLRRSIHSRYISVRIELGKVMCSKMYDKR